MLVTYRWMALPQDDPRRRGRWSTLGGGFRNDEGYTTLCVRGFDELFDMLKADMSEKA